MPQFSYTTVSKNTVLFVKKIGMLNYSKKLKKNEKYILKILKFWLFIIMIIINLIFMINYLNHLNLQRRFNLTRLLKLWYLFILKFWKIER